MLRKEPRGDTLILRIDRPEKLNAWDRELRDGVKKTLGEVDSDPDVKAVVFTGTGEKAFCAGADLTDTTIGVASAARDRMIAYRSLYCGIRSFRKPLVAALNGLAMGSAFQAVLLMDYRVAHRGVRLGLPEMNSGIPCITGSTILSWAIGSARARNIAITGRFLDADEALSLGLVDEIVEPEKVLDRSLEVAAMLSQKSPAAFAETKLWFRDMLQPALDAAFEHAAEVRSGEGMSRSIQAGVGGFLGRTPGGEGSA